MDRRDDHRRRQPSPPRRRGLRGSPPARAFPSPVGLDFARIDEAAGRAWINGREVGGGDSRFAYLERSYD
jgi:hypothetical protein